MEQKGFQLNTESFSCSICLDLLKDPVTIPCGHSYCMKCITNFWDKEDEKNIYSCPQCRRSFTPRPVVEKNVLLAALVEQLKATGLQAAPADHSYAGPEHVACDACTGRKLKAIKSCLTCLVSYCEKHLQPHYEIAQFKKHQLAEPSKKLHENICSRHDEGMKMFCRTDQRSICLVCTMDEHKGHDVVSAAAEQSEKQKKLEARRANIQQSIQEREEDMKLLQQELEAINVSADKSMEDSEEIFAQLIRVIQERSSEAKKLLRSQQETEVSRVKELQEKLEQEMRELKKEDAELIQLSHTKDHNQFLHNYPSESTLSQAPRSSISVRPLRYFGNVTAAVLELRDKLQDVVRDGWKNISLMVTEVDVLLSNPDPKTRSDFLKYSREITLDPNTAHVELVLSEGNKKVTLVKDRQAYPHHPERFNVPFQILSKESLTGCCYWEVKWGGEGVNVAVTYKDVDRTNTGFGFNDKSWALYCYKNQNIFYHNKIKTRISGCQVTTVGVYLDHGAGILSFYSISETMTLLHKVQTTFTKPLHAGIQLYIRYGDTAEICKLK